MTRLEFVIETLRAALNEAAIVSEPKKTACYARSKTIEQVGAEGMALLSAVYSSDAPAVLRVLPKVDLLRRCWLEQFYVDDGKVKLRDTENFKSSPKRLDTPYDTDAHYGVKGSAGWLG